MNATAPTYAATGEPMQVGDAVLAESGMIPAKIVYLYEMQDGDTAIHLKYWKSADQEVCLQKNSHQLVFIERQTANFRQAGRHRLSQGAQQ